MPVDQAKIAQMERELAEARAHLLAEDGERYRILMRELSPDERQRILDKLTDKRERQLFGLEPPDEPRRTRSSAPRAAKSGGDLTCPICGKSGLTKRGLALHTARVHKGEKAET
jgi:hypothetical protein